MSENRKDNKLVQHKSTNTAIQPADFNYIKKLAGNIVNSPLADPFKTKDKDGNIVVSEGAIIANMVLGAELGLSPVASLTLGKKLNANSYLSVLRGRELGLDSVSSMSKIYHIPNKNGSVIALAVDIIIAKILESGTSFNYIRDNEPTPMYKDLTGKYIGHKWLLFNDDNKIKDGFYLYQEGVSSKEELNDAKKRGDTIVYQFGITNVTSVRFIRKSNNIDMVVHYSLQEAIDAKLYRGFHSVLLDDKGKPLYVKGKDNWNNHPATHLRHRPLSIGGRIVAADLLMGNYSVEEAIEIINKDEVQNEDDLVDYQYNTAKDNYEFTSVKQ